ncbi:MAG: CinA family protein [Erysipelotrichaceae bacterium]|nr:CinA family protein [Erysipelotrichaceae bacterium]
MKELFELLKNKNYTIASCESLTAGLFCSKMAEIPHVSAVLKGGIVTYWTQIKEDVAQVSHDTVERYGVVSIQTAYEMAKNVQRIFDTDISVSFTGNAGPDVLEDKPAGLVYTSICVGNQIYGFSDLIKGSRNEVRETIVERTVERIKDILGKERYYR